LKRRIVGAFEEQRRNGAGVRYHGRRGAGGLVAGGTADRVCRRLAWRDEGGGLAAGGGGGGAAASRVGAALRRPEMRAKFLFANGEGDLQEGCTLDRRA
jgi:hypothetical protein